MEIYWSKRIDRSGGSVRIVIEQKHIILGYIYTRLSLLAQFCELPKPWNSQDFQHLMISISHCTCLPIFELQHTKMYKPWRCDWKFIFVYIHYVSGQRCIWVDIQNRGVAPNISSVVKILHLVTGQLRSRFLFIFRCGLNIWLAFMRLRSGNKHWPWTRA